MKRKMQLTGPTGIPSAVLNSSDKSPGFFSFSFVSNSFPLKDHVNGELTKNYIYDVPNWYVDIGLHS